MLLTDRVHGNILILSLYPKKIDFNNHFENHDQLYDYKILFNTNDYLMGKFF